MNSNNNSIDYQNQFEIFTIVDDDEQQQTTSTTARKSEVSRRKSISASSNEQLLNSSSSSTKIAEKIGHRRRKTFHKLLNADDEIIFESVIPDDNEIPVKKVKHQIRGKGTPKNSTETKVAKIFNFNKSPYNNNSYLHKENPNTEFIQRVAFLRSCVNYMLKNAGKDPIDFKYADNSLSKLLNNYISDASNEPEEIVLSD